MQVGVGGCRWVQVGVGGCRWVQVGAGGCSYESEVGKQANRSIVRVCRTVCGKG